MNVKAWIAGVFAAVVAGLVIALRAITGQRDRAREQRDDERRGRKAAELGRDRDTAVRDKQAEARKGAREHDASKRKSRRDGEPVDGNAGERLRDPD